MSLKNKTIGGVIWTVVDTFFLRGFSFLATLILARWLGPEEFGLVGMISVFIAIGTSITDSGLSTSLIRTRNANNQDFSTVFILNLILSIGVYIVFFLIAPLIADFFKQPILKNLIRVYCLSFIFSAFSAVQLARLTANMQFKKIAKLNIPGIIIGTLIGLSFGYFGLGVWSIVFMYLTTQFVQTLTLWTSSKWKPSLQFTKEKAKYHYGYGYKLMLSGILDTIFKNIYNIVIGKYYSAKELGFFERSKAFNDYPVTTITGIVSKVTFPLLSSIQDDKKRVSSLYKRLMGITFFITAPMMLGAAAIAYPLFLLVLGEEWTEAVPYFQILCLAGIFYPIHAFNLNVFKVYGRSNLFLKLEIIKKIIITIGLIIGFQFGIMGLVWSSVISNYLALFVNTYYSSNLINYSGKNQFFDMLPIFITSALMFGIVSFILLFVENLHLILQIIIGMTTGLVFYCLINRLIRTESLTYLLNLLKEKI